jgi:hypothetical protein
MKNHSVLARLLQLVSLLLLLGGGVAHPDVLMDRLTQDIDVEMPQYETFQLDIDEATVRRELPDAQASRSGYETVENLHIVCLQGCSPILKYSERFDDVPIAAFVLSDCSPDFITLWTTKRGYAIRVYHVARKSIAKVLDQASLTAPQVEAVDHGTLVVTLTNPALAARLKLCCATQTWRLEGRTFYMMPGDYHMVPGD